MADLGELIKSKRVSRGWSLRKLGDELDVTPAYIGDMEANRRLPSAELMSRLSTVLGIPAEELAAADSRLSPDLREWIEERPEVSFLLRGLRSLPNADGLIKRLQKLVTRRALPPPAGGFLVTWESELRAIAGEATAWTVETGGDLFGRWTDIPTVVLATKAGPNSQRDHTHFRLDVEYLREMSEALAKEWSLRYFGDWHSHHRLGLASPSGGDRRRIMNLAGRNQFTGMTEIIVTLEDSHGAPTVRIHPWLYDFTGMNNGPVPIRVKVLPGLSPIRQALIASKIRPEQDFSGWEKIPLHRIRIGSETIAPTLEPAAFDVDATTREKTVANLAAALQEESGHAIEQHATGFGSIIVAELIKPYYVAFAVGAAWPMPVLEVHLLDRERGTNDAIASPEGVSVLDVARLLEIFRNEKEKRGGADVD
jgi:transcriptional regulator with XRE-family HTH domain